MWDRLVWIIDNNNYLGTTSLGLDDVPDPKETDEACRKERDAKEEVENEGGKEEDDQGVLTLPAADLTEA